MLVGKGIFLLAPLCVIMMTTALEETLAFQCFVCDSKNDIECTENLPDNSRLTPKDCRNITGAKYCIKTTNVYAGELGTKRFCAANDHGNYCKYIRQPTGDREYRSCVMTCDSENCNGSRSLIDKQGILLAGTPLFLFACYLVLSLSNYEFIFLSI